MAAKEPEDDVVLQLLANKDFKDWIQNPSGDRDFYWQSWLKSNPDKLAAAKRAREIIQQLKFEETFLSEEETARLLQNIIADKPSTNASKVVQLNQQTRFRWIKIAASILLVLASGFYGYRFLLSGKAAVLQTVVAPNGQRRKISFPDGSVAHLNGGSTLTFPEEFSDTLRTVELIGEAFFEVVKNPSSPFVVKTRNIQTRVLGTSFNVRAVEAERSIDVSLVTGKVRVANQVLLPGEQLIYHEADSSFQKTTFETSHVIGWKDGVLVFHDTDFDGVVRRLEQWYGITIQVQHRPAGEWHMNGHFERQSLTEVLASIQFVYDISYTIQPDNTLTLICKE